MKTIPDADLLLAAQVMSAAENRDTYPFTVREHGPFADGAYDARVMYGTRAIVEYGIGHSAEEARANLMARMVARLRTANPSIADLTEWEIAERDRARTFAGAT